MDERDEDWLRGLMGAVPPPPEAPGRAAAARSRAARRRRRTTGVVVGAAVVAVLAVVALPAGLGGGDDADRPAAAPAPVPVVDIGCPALPEDWWDHRASDGDDQLPEGAVVARLCTGPGIGFQPPADALVTDVDRLVEVVNDQPVTGPPGACDADLGLGYQLAFGYPDGSVRTAVGELYGCHSLTVGDTVRSGPEVPLRRFEDLLREQRGASEPAVAEPSLACADGHGLGSEVSVVGRPSELTRAVVCVRDETHAPRPHRSVPVPADDLALLLADHRRRAAGTARPSEQECRDHPTSVTILGSTPWGDVVALSGFCGYWFEDEDGVWRPGPEARSVLDRLVASAPAQLPTVDASTPAAVVVASYVDLWNAGERAQARALWVDPASAPDGPDRIGYKGGAVRPWDPPAAFAQGREVEVLWWDAADGSGAYADRVVHVVRAGPGEPWRILDLR